MTLAAEDDDVVMSEMRDFDNYIGKVLTDATDDESVASEHSSSREVSVGEFAQSVYHAGAASLQNAYTNAVPSWMSPIMLRKTRKGKGGESQRRGPERGGKSPLEGLFSMASKARRGLDLSRGNPAEATNPQAEDGPPLRLPRRCASQLFDEAPAMGGREHSWPWREGSQQQQQQRKSTESSRLPARRRRPVVLFPTIAPATLEMLFCLAYYNWMGELSPAPRPCPAGRQCMHTSRTQVLVYVTSACSVRLGIQGGGAFFA